jgi:hypothetical protein
LKGKTEKNHELERKKERKKKNRTKTILILKIIYIRKGKTGKNKHTKIEK